MNLDPDANQFFLAFSGHKIPEMAQAVLDSGFSQGKCTLDELKVIFSQRGLGADNVMNFLRYVESVQDEIDATKNDT